MDAASRWDQRWAGAEPVGSPAGVLLQHRQLLAASLDRPNCSNRTEPVRALDVAGGQGRNALWLAELGFAVTLTDVSTVALQRADAVVRERIEAGADPLHLRTRQVDWESSDPDQGVAICPGPWHLVVIVAYLNRGLLERVPEMLERGGLAVFAQPTAHNLTRHERPSARFLLKPGEVATLAKQWGDDGLEVIEASEGWRSEGTHQGWLIAKRR